jgi:hypothetical protein
MKAWPSMRLSVFVATMFGTIVGGLIPIVAALCLRPAEARRQRRLELYLELVLPVIFAAQDRSKLLGISSALATAQRVALLAGREDCRVIESVVAASEALGKWAFTPPPPKEHPEQAETWSTARDVLREYVAEEMSGYHQWLRHSLARSPVQRRRWRHSRRVSAPWTSAIEPFIGGPTLAPGVATVSVYVSV